jgi:hypothetical protein
VTCVQFTCLSQGRHKQLLACSAPCDAYKKPTAPHLHCPSRAHHAWPLLPMFLSLHAATSTTWVYCYLTCALPCPAAKLIVL